MAEPFAIAASVFATIHIAETVIAHCKYFIETTQDAPSDLYVIQAEVSATKSFFESWKSMSEANNDLCKRLNGLDGESGPIEGCRRSIHGLEKLIDIDEANIPAGAQSERGKFRKSLTALKWPLKAGKATKLLQQLNGYKASISMAMTTQSTQDVQEMKSKVDQVYAILTYSQRQELYRSIRHTDPSSLHNRARANYEPGTCDWLLRIPEWKSWIDGQEQCLWIHGIPGAGKTILLSHAIETIQQHCKQQPDSHYACVYYYCYFGHDQDETLPFLRWLLEQLCRDMDQIPEVVSETFERGLEPSVEDLVECLVSTLDAFDRVYVVLDAIDESKKPWDSLLQIVKELTSDLCAKISLVASSREYGDIVREMDSISNPVSMSNPEVEKDIRVCVKSLLCNKRRFGHYAEDLLVEAENAITLGAQGMFRWAVCQIDVIHRLKSDRQIILKALRNLPATIYETYDRILDMIPKEEQLFVWNALQWTRCTYDLGLESPTFEIFLEGMSDFMKEVDPGHNQRFYDEELLQDLCGCLMNIQQVEQDQVVGTMVSFAHYTVQEYIVSGQAARSSPSCTHLREENTRKKFINCILPRLTHIQSESFRADLEEPINPPSFDGPFDFNWRRNFDRFCLVSSFSIWSQWQYTIASDDSLYALTVTLLDPRKSHFQSLKEAVYEIWTSRGNKSIMLGTPLSMWDITWDRDDEQCDLLHLWYLLSMSYSKLRVNREDYLDATVIIRKYLSENSDKALLWKIFGPTLRLKSMMGPQAQLGGTVFEVLDRVGGDMGNAIYYFLPFFINEYCAEMDSTAPLCLCLMHPGSSMGEMADSLLQAGADPDGSNYRVTPLQIAVMFSNDYGVEWLLKAGAHPNRVGEKNGTRWKYGSYLHPFNYLHGASPLHICLNREDYNKRRERQSDELHGTAWSDEIGMDVDDEQYWEDNVDSDTEANIKPAYSIGVEKSNKSDIFPSEDDASFSRAVAVDVVHSDMDVDIDGSVGQASSNDSLAASSEKEVGNIQRGHTSSGRGDPGLKQLADIGAKRKARITALLIEHGAEDFCDL